MATKTLHNSWDERIEVSDEGGIIRLQLRPNDNVRYVNLTPEQADELGRTLQAFAQILEAQESSI